MAMPPGESASRKGRRLRLALAGALGMAVLAGAGLWAREEVIVGRAARAARRAVAARKFDEAEAALARWRSRRPDSAEAHYLEARAALGRDLPDRAMEEIGRAEALGHDRAALDRARAVVLARAGKLAEAEELLRRSPTGDGPDADVDEAWARIYLGTFRFGQAKQALARWRREAPADPRPYLWQAEIDSRREDGLPDLIEDYREALRRDPSLDKARLGLADALRDAGRPDEAAAEYSAYLARRPDDPAGHLGAGRAALALGDEPGAIAHLDRALHLDPKNVPALIERAAIEQRRGRPESALALLDRAAASDPHDPEIRHRRALALSRLGREDEAARERQAANRLRQDQEHMNNLRKQLLDRPDDRGLQAEVARWLIEHGHEEEGLRWARKVLGEEPGHAQANRLMAEYHARRGETGLANYYRLQAGGPPDGGAPP